MEPYFVATFERYLKGCLVKIKAPDDYPIYFKTTGFKNIDEIKSFVDGEGYTNWVIAGPSDLLLPGQGYIIVLNPINK